MRQKQRQNSRKPFSNQQPFIKFLVKNCRTGDKAQGVGVSAGRTEQVGTSEGSFI